MAEESFERGSEESAYTGKWWIEDLTEEEERLYSDKYYGRLPWASLPRGIAVEKDVHLFRPYSF